MHEPRIAIHSASSILITLINRALPIVNMITRSTQRTISINAIETQTLRASDSTLMYRSAKQYPMVPHNTIIMQIADSSLRYWRKLASPHSFKISLSQPIRKHPMSLNVFIVCSPCFSMLLICY